MNEKEQAIADKILELSKSTVKNVGLYLTLLKAVELRLKIEKMQNPPTK